MVREDLTDGAVVVVLGLVGYGTVYGLAVLASWGWL